MRYPNADKSQSPPQQTVGASTPLATGWYLRSQSQWTKAAGICREILSKHPERGEAWHLLGLLAHDQGDHSQAVAHLKKAIAVEPHQVLHYNNLGVVLNDMRLYTQAEDFLSKALKICPDNHDAKTNLGLTFFYQSQLARAADCFEEIISIDPQHSAALANLGMTRLSQQKFHEAASAYHKAIAIDSAQPNWHGNLGAAFMRMGRFKRATRCYENALKQNPQKVDYHVSLGIALRAAGDLPGSISALELALSMQPQHPEALANLVVGLEYTCQWDKLELLYPLLNQSTQKALKSGETPDEEPMLNIRHAADIALNQSVAHAWACMIQNRAMRVLPRFLHDRSRQTDSRITIGYLSNDFRNHPVAHQLYPLFKLHDRKRFRVIAFSMGPDDGSKFRQAIQADSDEFIDISALGLEQAGRIIYDRRVDILIDLMGHSHHNRMEILSLRPAPVQMSYLGFLSTTGADYIDYVVADPIVVPPEHDRFFNEKVLRLPHCYQMNHSLMSEGRTDGHRKKWGLPPDGFVYACFNMVYKIDRHLFNAWMRILEQTPDSVLWLYGAHPKAVDNMKLRAEKLGIDPQRLVFADKIPLGEHLSRLPLADLALDTLRYNGGATTSNALSVGLPVITVMGQHWVSRMSASHLIAVGLPDLVFDHLESYEQAAIAISRNPDQLLGIKQRLAKNLKTHPLFDSHGFVRHLETGYELIWRRYLDDHEPCNIDIPERD